MNGYWLSPERSWKGVEDTHRKPIPWNQCSSQPEDQNLPVLSKQKLSLCHILQNVNYVIYKLESVVCWAMHGLETSASPQLIIGCVSVSELECCNNSCIDFLGIPEFSSRLIPPSLINFDHTYHMLWLINFQSYECDKRFTEILYVVWCLFYNFSRFCRFQWHLIYIFSVFPQIFFTGNYFPEITSRFPDHFSKSGHPGIAAIG